MKFEEIFEGGEHIYIVLNLCKGINLLEYLKIHNLPGE